MKFIVEIEEEKVAFFIELLSNLPFVKVKPLSPYKSEVFDDLTNAVEEMNLLREGKLKGTPAKDLLDEL